MYKNYLRSLSFRHSLSSLALIVVLLATACDRQKTAPPSPSVPGEVRTFTGTWSATGNSQTMQLESGHQAGTFRLTGSLLLKGKQRLKKGFKADLIGFSDNRTGMQGRSVWTDERGDKVFSALQGEADVTNTVIAGNFLGGTGRYANVTGEYTFKWKRLTKGENGEISGRVVDFKGWARLGSPNVSPDTIGNPQ